MHCKFCGFANGEDDHRCLRCGRRLSGVVLAAPPGYSGANALAPVLSTLSDDTTEFPPVEAVQPNLFSSNAQPSPNVIPFDRRERQVTSQQAASTQMPHPPAVMPPV